MTAAVDLRSPFVIIGGREGVRDVVERFYDLMESDPAYRELRALHADDLTPMRHSLAGFLMAWLGGPRDWFVANPGKCMMSAHASVAVDAATADQWVKAMAQAIRDCDVDPDLASRMIDAFSGMASAMERSA